MIRQESVVSRVNQSASIARMGGVNVGSFSEATGHVHAKCPGQCRRRRAIRVVIGDEKHTPTALHPAANGIDLYSIERGLRTVLAGFCRQVQAEQRVGFSAGCVNDYEKLALSWHSEAKIGLDNSDAKSVLLKKARERTIKSVRRMRVVVCLIKTRDRSIAGIRRVLNPDFIGRVYFLGGASSRGYRGR
jgi:hypothetical protein